MVNWLFTPWKISIMVIVITTLILMYIYNILSFKTCFKSIFCCCRDKNPKGRFTITQNKGINLQHHSLGNGSIQGFHTRNFYSDDSGSVVNNHFIWNDQMECFFDISRTYVPLSSTAVDLFQVYNNKI